jgi:glycosyltransferase-like protein
LRAVKVALLTHSTNPRGGVVHALEVGDALHDMGVDATVVAPDPGQRGLFRAARCAYIGVPAAPASGDLAALVRQRIADYVAWFERPGTPRFDIYHAQDSISANALADLAARGRIPGFVRTVHHLDQFDDPQLAAWQARGYQAASTVLCVSRLWQSTLAHAHGIDAALVANGVDIRRYAPCSGSTVTADAALRRKLALGDGPVFLAVGGVEPRKNTLRILAAFLTVRAQLPAARLVIAGGVSLLDHGAYADRFDALVRAAPGPAPMLLGRVDDADMAGLYRCADALVFPSVREGFGLAVLEAMACGTPAVVSRIAPFTDYLPDGCCLWADPQSPAAIAAAMLQACDPRTAAGLRAAGQAVASRHTWAASAAGHHAIYQSIHQRNGVHHA